MYSICNPLFLQIIQLAVSPITYIHLPHMVSHLFSHAELHQCLSGSSLNHSYLQASNSQLSNISSRGHSHVGWTDQYSLRKALLTTFGYQQVLTNVGTGGLLDPGHVSNSYIQHCQFKSPSVFSLLTLFIPGSACRRITLQYAFSHYIWGLGDLNEIIFI